MLSLIHAAYAESWGPLRLLNSFFFLAGAGFAASALITWISLPLLWRFLPTDRGRAFAVNAELSVGKPVSAGLIFVSIFCLVSLVFVPISARCLWTIPLMIGAMIVGYLDDKRGGYSEYTLAILDLIIAFAAAITIWGVNDVTIWLPGWRPTITLEPWYAIPLATGVIWMSINAVNCSDGVDGVSGSLTGTAIMLLGALLYAVIGNQSVAGYLRVPFNPEGQAWGIMAFLMVGCLAGYLWYNAAPSQVLMGDSGSRPLGLLIGMLVLATNNPLFLLMIGSIILLNGATGIFKVALLRFFKVRVLAGIRFPLHDHCRKELGWSNTQVLVRFMLLHLAVSGLLMIIALKVR
jgi:phospho-N-acetylmuramoyl-pentapeptide-transferase